MVRYHRNEWEKPIHRSHEWRHISFRRYKRSRDIWRLCPSQRWYGPDKQNAVNRRKIGTVVSFIARSTDASGSKSSTQIQKVINLKLCHTYHLISRWLFKKSTGDPAALWYCLVFRTKQTVKQFETQDLQLKWIEIVMNFAEKEINSQKVKTYLIWHLKDNP